MVTAIQSSERTVNYFSADVQKVTIPTIDKVKGVGMELLTTCTGLFALYGTPFISALLSSSPINILRLITIDSILFLSLWEATKKAKEVSQEFLSGTPTAMRDPKERFFVVERSWKSYRSLAARVMQIAVSVSFCALSYVFLSYWVLSHPAVQSLTFSPLARILLLCQYTLCRINAVCFYELSKQNSNP